MDIVKIATNLETAEILLVFNLADQIGKYTLLMTPVFFHKTGYLLAGQCGRDGSLFYNEIKRVVKKLKELRADISELLGRIDNKQIVYLGNAARKIIYESIKLTEDWIDKTSE